MSRSGYSDDWDDQWRMIMYRANVDRALHGKRGQKFLRELLAALDAMPEKRLITHAFEKEEGVCALGAVGRARGNQCTVPTGDGDYQDTNTVAVGRHFGIAACMAAEIMYVNDEWELYWREVTPERRYQAVRQWVVNQITNSPPTP